MRFLLLLFVPISVQAQDTIPLSLVASFPNLLDETSGLSFIDGTLWTFNDGGASSVLHQIDTTTATVIQSVSLQNASNIDWESIAHDDQHVYVGDFGNNDGDRMDLRIYILSKDSLLNGSGSVTVTDTIQFSYSDQSSFVSSPNATNHDCEALIAYGDSLYLFTKRWLDNRSYVYGVPKTPGQYTLGPLDSLETDGLITGADVNSEGLLVLCGYTTSGSAFLRSIEGFSFPLPSQGTLVEWIVDQPLLQLEGITSTYGRAFFFSSEALFNLIPARLWKAGIPLSSHVGDFGIEENILIVRHPMGFSILSEKECFLDYRIFSSIGSFLGKGSTRTGEIIPWPDRSEGIVIIQATIEGLDYRIKLVK